MDPFGVHCVHFLIAISIINTLDIALQFFFACSIFYWFLRTKHVEWKLHILKPFTKSVQLEETTKRVGLVAETLFV